ncbi:Zn-dependent protease with chaperone function [Pedococcus dokdonensis]|uniref:Zn-dependent protease with chaperone function n=1 Tax=Pedococcus dokdonensis TaxID=443156 RepID=A0A1H0TU75_9MICO|nr:M56 family metallopeptidase [Pedococcus dokdonensis]SDP57208.1 Zn-dependent protease with chaperone function [Pedococcus dokdonensis]
MMARRPEFRRAPREALLVWQSVSLAGVVAALAVAPAAALSATLSTTLPRWVPVVAVAFSGAMLGRLLWSGHTIGTRLRAQRREQRTLVDALGTDTGDHVRVLAHPTPTAYCLPGLRRRVVLTEGTLAALPPDELAAVMAHERAHLRARHDLVLEFFSVLHRAVPARLRAAAALREVHLLIEVLADRAARRAVGPVPLARALAALASASHPDTALGATNDQPTTAARMRLLTEPPAAPWLRAAMLAFAVAVLAAPVVLLVVALG